MNGDVGEADPTADFEEAVPEGIRKLLTSPAVWDEIEVPTERMVQKIKEGIEAIQAERTVGADQ